MRFDRRSDIDADQLDALIRKEIAWEFYKNRMTDQRVKKLYDVSEKELKEESYAIFFKSLDDILEQVGIPHHRQIIFHLSWYRGLRIIKGYDRLWETLTAREKDDEEEPEAIEYDLNYNLLWFRWKRMKHTLGISSRVKLIVNYLTTKRRLEPLFEAAQHYKHDPTPIVEHGETFYPWDLTHLLREYGTSYGEELESKRNEIWNPEIKWRWYDEASKEKVIGDLYN
jgi:hypothetical protein